jgi:ribose transport system substrate-binding protein
VSKFRVFGALAVVLLAAALVAGCGSSSDSGSTGAGTSGGGSTRSEGGPAADFVAEATEALETNYEGTDGPVPTSAPKPPASKNVWMIACSLAAEGCAVPAKGAAEAASALGWKTHVADGKLDPSVYNSLVTQAIAAKANAIVLVAVDCALTKGSLEQARSAGVKIVAIFSNDCNEEPGGGPKLFDTQIRLVNNMTYGEWVEGPFAESQADWVIAKTEGKADVIVMREDDVATARRNTEGFERAMEKCTTCEVKTVEFTGADLLNGGLQGKVETALSQDPGANVVYAPYDASIPLGIGPAVMASGRGSEILVVGCEGLAPNIELIESGKGDNFAAGSPSRWNGWAAIDELIRSFDGEKEANEGIGLQSIDQEHNSPKTTPYYDGNTVDGKPKQDYEKEYLKIWGVG